MEKQDFSPLKYTHILMSIEYQRTRLDYNLTIEESNLCYVSSFVKAEL